MKISKQKLLKIINEEVEKIILERLIQEYRGPANPAAKEVIRTANKEAVKTVIKTGISRNALRIALRSVGGIILGLFWPSVAGKGSTLSPAQRKAQQDILRKTAEKTGVPSPDIEKIIKKEAEKAVDIIEFPGSWEPPEEEETEEDRLNRIYGGHLQASSFTRGKLDLERENPEKYCEEEIEKLILQVAIIESKLNIVQKMKAIRDRYNCGASEFKQIFDFLLSLAFEGRPTYRDGRVGPRTTTGGPGDLRDISSYKNANKYIDGDVAGSIENYVEYLKKILKRDEARLNSLLEKCAMTKHSREIDLEARRYDIRNWVMCNQLNKIMNSGVFDFLDTDKGFGMGSNLKRCLPLKQEIRKMLNDYGC